MIVEILMYAAIFILYIVNHRTIKYSNALLLLGERQKTNIHDNNTIYERKCTLKKLNICAKHLYFVSKQNGEVKGSTLIKGTYLGMYFFFILSTPASICTKVQHID